MYYRNVFKKGDLILCVAKEGDYYDLWDIGRIYKIYHMDEEDNTMGIQSICLRYTDSKISTEDWSNDFIKMNRLIEILVG